MSNLDIEVEFRQYAELLEIAERAGMAPGAITAITKAMGAGKTAIDITKAMTDLVGKTQNADLIDQMADLKLAMAELKGALADAKNEITDLEEENSSLQRQLKEAQSPSIEVIQKRGLSYVKGKENTPICGACHGNTGRIIPINRADKPRAVQQALKDFRPRFECSICKGTLFEEPIVMMPGEGPKEIS